MEIIDDRRHLVRAFGGCTVEVAVQRLDCAWKYIESQLGGSLTEIPAAISSLPVRGTLETLPLVHFNPRDVKSVEGHVQLVLEALRWFAANTPHAIVRECHPTQSDNNADLWVLGRDGTQFICEATAKSAWANWAKKRGSRGAGAGMSKRRHQVKILSELAAAIQTAEAVSVVKCHILPRVLAARQARQPGSRLMEGSDVIVAFI